LKTFLTDGADEATIEIARKRVNEIAVKLTLPRSEDQILLRAVRLKIYKSLKFDWMEEEDEMLTKMLKEKKTLKNIAVVMHWRSHSTIEKHVEKHIRKLSTK
jgi:hypothetical protein